MVASHTETPLGVSKWLVKATPTHGTLPLGKGHGLTMSPTQGQAILLGGNLIPAISQSPRGQLYGWLPLSDAAGIIILQFGIPILFHSTMSFLCWALQMPVLDTPELRIRLNGILSNNIRILSLKNGGCRSRKSHSVEKTAIFEVFGNLLVDRWLHGFLSVNKRFTKSEFARGKVLVHER